MLVQELHHVAVVVELDEAEHDLGAGRRHVDVADLVVRVLEELVQDL